MKTNEDKHIEELVDKIMKNQPLEIPSFDFTTKVMNQVVERKNNTIFIYKPLLSKQTSIAIFSIVILFIAFLMLDTNLVASKGYSTTHVNSIFKNPFSGMLNFSTITMYGTVLGTVMLLGQIIFLQNHLNNRR